MKKKTVSIISLVLLLALLLGNSAFAAVNASEQISSTSAIAYSGGSGKINISITIVGNGGMSMLGAMYIYIYESDGTYIKTLSYGSTDGMMSYNTGYYSSVIPCTVPAGHSYYAGVVFYAQDSYGHGDSVTVYTGTASA